jgi:hypothetical protein
LYQSPLHLNRASEQELLEGDASFNKASDLQLARSEEDEASKRCFTDKQGSTEARIMLRCFGAWGEHCGGGR